MSIVEDFKKAMREGTQKHTRDWVKSQLGALAKPEVNYDFKMNMNTRDVLSPTVNQTDSYYAEKYLPEEVNRSIPNYRLERQEFNKKGGINYPDRRETTPEEKGMADASNVMSFSGIDKLNPAIQESVEPFVSLFSAGLEQINRGIHGDEGVGGSIADVAIGSGKTAISGVMKYATMLQPVADKLGEAVGDNVAGDIIKEFTPFLAFKNPLALYGAAKGSEEMNKVAHAVIESSPISEKNKARVSDVVGLGSFILTHKLISKTTGVANRAIGKYLDKKGNFDFGQTRLSPEAKAKEKRPLVRAENVAKAKKKRGYSETTEPIKGKNNTADLASKRKVDKVPLREEYDKTATKTETADINRSRTTDVTKDFETKDVAKKQVVSEKKVDAKEVKASTEDIGIENKYNGVAFKIGGKVISEPWENAKTHVELANKHKIFEKYTEQQLNNKESGIESGFIDKDGRFVKQKETPIAPKSGEVEVAKTNPKVIELEKERDAKISIETKKQKGYQSQIGEWKKQAEDNYKKYGKSGSVSERVYSALKGMEDISKEKVKKIQNEYEKKINEIEQTPKTKEPTKAQREKVHTERNELQNESAKAWMDKKEGKLTQEEYDLKIKDINKRAEDLNQAFKNIKEKSLGRTNMFGDPTIIKDYVVVAKHWISQGVKTFKEFAKKMIDKFGAGVRPKLREIWTKSNESSFKKRMSEHKPKKEVEKKGVDLGEETLVGWLDRKFSNRFSRVEKMAKRGKEGKALAEEVKLYSSRAAEAFDKVLDYMKNPKDGFVKKLSDIKANLDDIGEFLIAQHAKERNAKLLEKTKVKDGSSISDVTADKILNKYKGTEVPKLANEFRKNVVEKNLDLLYKNGFLTKEQYDALKTFDYYVPLKGKDGTTAIQLGGKKLSVNSKGIYRMKGRESIPNNPVSQAIMDFKDTIVRVEKNKVLQEFGEFIEKNPSNMYEIKGMKQVPQYNVHGEIINFNKQKLGDNQLSFYRDGKQKVITLNDKALLESFEGLGGRRSMKVLSKVNDYLRSVITIHNPEFLITNFQRDIQTALINLSAEKSVKIAGKVAIDTPKAIRGVWKSERGSKPNAWTKEFDELRELGGKTGWMGYKNLGELEIDFMRELSHFNKKGKVRQAAKSTLKYIDDLNLAVENGVRVSTFKNLKDAGYTPREAALAAKGITVDFNRKGEWGQAINTAYLFWNAGMQGTVRIFKALSSKRGKAFAGGLVALGALENQINKQIDPETYNKLSDWEKDANWIFMTGSGGYLKIKKPYGYSVFPTLGNISADVYEGKIKSVEGASRMLKSLADAFSPFGQTGSWAQLVSPTVADPVVQLIENKNFAGQPIYKEQPSYGVLKPNAEMHFKSVNPYTKIGTEFLNKVFGADVGEAGALDLNPEYVEHYLEFIGGGVGKFLSNTAQTSYSLFDKKELPETYKTPILRKFYGEPPDWIDMNIVYSMLKEAGRTRYDKDDTDKFYKSLLNATKQGKLSVKQYRSMRTQFREAQARKK